MSVFVTERDFSIFKLKKNSFFPSVILLQLALGKTRAKKVLGTSTFPASYSLADYTQGQTGL